MKYNIIENEIKYNDEIKNEINEIINDDYELKLNICNEILKDLKRFDNLNVYITLIKDLIKNNDNEFIENYIINNYHIDINKKIMMINNYYENDLYDIVVKKRNDLNE